MITERMQRNLIYRAFVAKEIESEEINLDGWRWPWREIVLAAERDAWMPIGTDVLHHAVQLVAGEDMDARRAWMAAIEEAAEPLQFPTLAEIAESLPPVSWLWPGWLPRGMLSLLGAYQGTGKSYFVLDLARTVIHGGMWPDGTAVETQGSVIYVEAEAIPQVTNERAVKLGIDRNRLWLMMAENGELLDLTQSRWQDRLVDMATTVRPQLIVIDSLTSISSIGQNSVEDTNRLLMFLVGLARYVDCGLLVLHHLRKPPGGQLSLPGMSIHDFRGSSHITAMARTILGLAVVQTGRQFSLNGARRLDLVKTNLGPYPDEGIGVQLETTGESVRFVYGAPASFDQEAESPGEKCEEWLLTYLEKHGPSRPGDVRQAAEAAGFTHGTLTRARKALSGAIRDTESNFRSPKNLWRLAAAGEDETDGGDGDDGEQLQLDHLIT